MEHNAVWYERTLPQLRELKKNIKRQKKIFNQYEEEQKKIMAQHLANFFILIKQDIVYYQDTLYGRNSCTICNYRSLCNYGSIGGQHNRFPLNNRCCVPYVTQYIASIDLSITYMLLQQIVGKDVAISILRHISFRPQLIEYKTD